jgi:hypothetical protein
MPDMRAKISPPEFFVSALALGVLWCNTDNPDYTLTLYDFTLITDFFD